MSKLKKILVGLIAVALLVVIIGLAVSWRFAIAPIETFDVSQFTPEQLARGEKLAELGDCAVCHTAPKDGIRNAGGFPLEIPFGVIYATNITPDRETGIGKYSYEAFERAMRHGVDRTGKYLYPAFPYTSFTRTSDEDMLALYGYLMSQPAVNHEPPKTNLMFPFNIRQGIYAWNFLFLDVGPMKIDTTQSEEWNRGAYLAEALGHCSACHSPRNIFYGEKGGAAHLTGGEAEGWHAPSLVGTADIPLNWSKADLVTYMRTGFSENHGVAAGPMAPVIEEGLSRQSDADLNAIATYLTSYYTTPDAHPEESKQAHNITAEAKIEPLATEGARLFSGACMACHSQEKGAQMYGVRPSLALNTNMFTDTPDNVIYVTLNGIQEPANPELGFMPAFRHNLNDQQIAALLNYLRTDFAGKEPWPNLEQRVAELREVATH